MNNNINTNILSKHFKIKDDVSLEEGTEQKMVSFSYDSTISITDSY